MSATQPHELADCQQHQQDEAATTAGAAEGSSQQDSQQLSTCCCHVEAVTFSEAACTLSAEAADLQHGHDHHSCTSSSNGDASDAGRALK